MVNKLTGVSLLEYCLLNSSKGKDLAAPKASAGCLGLGSAGTLGSSSSSSTSLALGALAALGAASLGSLGAAVSFLGGV